MYTIKYIQDVSEYIRLIVRKIIVDVLIKNQCAEFHYRRYTIQGTLQHIMLEI